MTFDRRSYLKGAVIAGGGLLGLGGTVQAMAEGDSQDNFQAAPRERACPPGTTELARYSVNGGSFSLERGADVVSFLDIPQQGPVRSFSWESEDLVATTSVRTGPDRQRYEGGFSGSVSLDDSGPPISDVSFCAPRGGRAVLCELDHMMRSVEEMENGLTSSYDADFHLSGDPVAFDSETDSERDGVVQVQSTQATSDYAHGMVNVASQIDETLALGEVTELGYDFFVGEGNTGVMPDEVFVTVLTDNDDLKIAVTTLNGGDSERWAPADTGDGWQTLDVKSVIDETEWNIQGVEFMDIVTSEGVIETAQRLRSQPDRTVVLGDEYAEATLTGVGFGAGNTMEPTNIERYFDNLTLEWATPQDGDGTDEASDAGTDTESADEGDKIIDFETGEATFEFPALLPLSVDEVTQRGQGQVVITLALQQEEQGVELADVIEESVKLNAYGPFAPPSEPGAAPQTVRLEDESLVVQFRRQDVDEAVEDGRFIVSGDFEGQAGYAFVAIGERE